MDGWLANWLGAHSRKAEAVAGGSAGQEGQGRVVSADTGLGMGPHLGHFPWAQSS